MLSENRSENNEADYRMRMRYETLRSILNRNGNALQLLADLQTDFNSLSGQHEKIHRRFQRLTDETALMVEELNLMTNNKYTKLYNILFRIAAEVNSILNSAPENRAFPIGVNLTDSRSENPQIVGGKSSGITLLRQHFGEIVPDGFTITTAAYQLFLEENNLLDRIRILLTDMDVISDRDEFRARTRAIRDLFLQAKLPEEIRESIHHFVSETTKKEQHLWAVRSSSLSEDSRFTFAGQFDSKLMVPPSELEDAYRFVLASRFNDRAVLYRMNCGFREVDTPMAVLFMPMVDAQAAGVIYSINPQDAGSEEMVINSVPGLGESVVKGTAKADIFYISRETRPKLVKAHRVQRASLSDYLSEEMISKIGSIAMEAANALGHELDIEWATDKNGMVWILQGRRINIASNRNDREPANRRSLPLIEGGMTIVPGRAEGRIFWLSQKDDPALVPKESVLVADQATPDLAPALSRIAALLIVEGNPAGHLAAVLREFSVPCIYRLGNNKNRLIGKSVVSVDATKRKIYEGSRWPEVRQRVHNRIKNAESKAELSPLYHLISSFNQTDPYSASFQAKNCRSIHDIIRFAHEMSVRSMFGFGDRQRRQGLLRAKRIHRLRTNLPLRLYLVDLDGCILEKQKKVRPELVKSLPFEALWSGISDSKLTWPERWNAECSNFPLEFRERVFGGNQGPRRSKDANYAMVAGDYLNLNARFAYHYAMIDAIAGFASEGNHVHFRFRGGGASDENRIRRAQLLEVVLRKSSFSVDRRGDLVTAWLRHYPARETKYALEMLGRLMVCARQLDLVLKRDSDVKIFAEKFLNGEYQVFG